MVEYINTSQAKQKIFIYEFFAKNFRNYILILIIKTTVCVFTMSRARSSSIYTKRPEIKVPSTTGRSSLPTTLEHLTEPLDLDLPPLPVFKKAASAQDISTMFEEFGPVVEKKFREDFTGDFGKTSRCSLEESMNNSGRSTVSTVSRTSSHSTNSSTSCAICPITFSTVIFDDYFSGTQEKVQKMFKGMMIGSRAAGKRTLLQGMFPDHKVNIPYTKQSFDLVTKTIEKSTFINRYHFWLKEPSNVSNKLDPLLNMYYKNCAVVFLVYNPDCKNSFSDLEKELSQVTKANLMKGLSFTLVANKRGGPKNLNKVTANEVAAFREKYGIKNFIELDCSKPIPFDLRNLVEAQLKHWISQQSFKVFQARKLGPKIQWIKVYLFDWRNARSFGT